MMFGRTSLLLMIAAHVAVSSAPALAQQTYEQGYEIEGKGRTATTRRDREASQPTGSDTYTVTTRRTYDGGYTTKDSDGYSVSTRRTYDGGYVTKDNEGYSESCRPTYNGHTCRRTMPRNGQ